MAAGVGRRVAGFTHYALEKLWVVLHRGADLAGTVVVVGVPRSGSTWVMEVLEAVGGFRVVFEPFHPEYNPGVRRLAVRLYARVVHRPYLPWHRGDPLLEGFVEDVLRGRYAGRWYAGLGRLARSLRWLLRSRVLVKDVWTTRLLPWIASRYSSRVSGVFLLLRHPGAVIESQLRTCIGNPLCRIGVGEFRRVLVESLGYIEELWGLRGRLERRLLGLEKSWELLAALYAIDYSVPLTYAGRGWFYTVSYEGLASDPVEGFAKLAGLVGVDADPGVLADAAGRPAATARDRVFGVGKWRERLGHERVEDILRVLDWFDFNYYGWEPFLAVEPRGLVV